MGHVQHPMEIVRTSLRIGVSKSGGPCCECWSFCCAGHVQHPSEVVDLIASLGVSAVWVMSSTCQMSYVLHDFQRQDGQIPGPGGVQRQLLPNRFRKTSRKTYDTCAWTPNFIIMQSLLCNHCYAIIVMQSLLCSHCYGVIVMQPL